MIEQQIILDGVKYIVRSDEAGPYVIYKRKLYSSGTPFECWYNASQWHRSMGIPTRGKVAKILELVRK